MNHAEVGEHAAQSGVILLNLPLALIGGVFALMITTGEIASSSVSWSRDYPCLTIENEEPPTLTKYGRMRERYLREHRKVLYCNLLTSGKLYEHLAEIDTSACNMAEYLIKEMARKQGVTEQLKAEDMMRWVGLMNNIRACADEIVLNDIVYS